MSGEHLEVDEYFLSASNPLATADQRDIEQHAIALMESPAYGRARAMTERRWRELAGSAPTEEGWDRFQTFIDECVFANLLKALNGDPNHPRVLRIVMPPHDWFDMSVPGSRFGGGPGANQSYAIIPVDYGGRYRIHGRWIGMPPADHNYTLSPNAYFMNSIATFHHDDLVLDDDSRFTLTVGPEAGAAITSRPGQAPSTYSSAAVVPTGARRRLRCGSRRCARRGRSRGPTSRSSHGRDNWRSMTPRACITGCACTRTCSRIR